MQIKHISFDFWDTLFKGNPDYRKERFKYLSEKFDKSEDELDVIIKEVKKFCDKTSEQTMSTIDTTTQIYHVISKLTNYCNAELVSDVEFHFEYLFRTFPPIPLFTYDLMSELRSLDVSLSISCNTGIISGNSIELMIKEEDHDYFDFQLYSDEISFFKPSPLFAGEIVNGNGCRAYKFEDVLHVGDNINTDGRMCELTGMQFLHVEKGKPDFKQIFKILQ